jgi:hypothetical protein
MCSRRRATPAATATPFKKTFCFTEIGLDRIRIPRILPASWLARGVNRWRVWRSQASGPAGPAAKPGTRADSGTNDRRHYDRPAGEAC